MSLTLIPLASLTPVTVTDTPRGAVTTNAVAAAFSDIPGSVSDVPGSRNGPPSWHQSVNIGNDYPYYRPNFILEVAILWFVALFVVFAWAVILRRRSKRKNQGGSSIIQELLSWKKGYWTTIVCMSVVAAFAAVDDEIRIFADQIQQQYFLIQVLFNIFDYLMQLFLLFASYNVLFQLMRWSALRSKMLRSKYFGKFLLFRLGICIGLGVIAIVLEGLSIAYLKQEVFSPDATSTESIGNAAFNCNLSFQIAYWLLALEILIVSGHMVTVQRKHHMGKPKLYHTNLFVIALPFFVAASVRVLGVFIGIPPMATYVNSDDYHTYVYPSIAICAVLAPVGYISALGGIAAVAKNLESFKYEGEMLGPGERLGSRDIVMVDRDPQAAQDPPVR